MIFRSALASFPRSVFLILPLAVAAGGCAPKLAALPSGPGTPYADHAAAYEQATGSCRTVRTFAAVLNLSGRAGETRLRGRVNAGFAAPGQIRLEGLPPALAFGRPFFVLVGRAGTGMLVLPRDRRVLESAPVEDIIEALAGVALTADELLAAVSGCGLGPVEPTAARTFPNGWVAADAGETTIWLRNIDGVWRTVATVRGSVEIRYEEFASAYPARIRIRTTRQGPAAADITLRVSDVDINTELGPEVFQEQVPDGAAPLTLDELRRASGLGVRDPGLGTRGSGLVARSPWSVEP